MALVIYGCGGHARSVASSYIRNNGHEIVFVDENARDDEFIWGYPVLKQYHLSDEDDYFIAIGSNEKRKKVTESLNLKKKPINIIDMSANVSVGAQIGSGCFIGCGAYIGPDVVIGEGAIINTNAVIEHETIIGNWSHIAPNATVCGRSVIGAGVMLGTGCHIIDYINICDDICVGAGAVVVKDLTEPGVYIGIPVRRRE